MKKLSILFLILLQFCVQSSEPQIDKWEQWEPFSSEYSINDLERVQNFESPGIDKGESTLIEASGLAYSRKNPGHVWSHQDSSNDNLIFLLDANTAETVAAYRIPGVNNRDWEDMEIGPGPVDGVDYLYLGEIGDNRQVFSSYRIYRFEEPIFEEAHRGEVVTLEWEFDLIEFDYPDKSHDAEALMVDPFTKDIFIATKRDFRSMVFVAPYPQPVNEKFTLTHVGDLGFTRALAGTVSADGNEVLIKNDDRIFFWERNEGESFEDILARTPKLAPYEPVEPQGEAICFDPNGGYYTLSEFSNGIVPVLYHYQRK
ncbi:hypothetical protein [Litoribacter populi]|uniref:hypothetical protein n=1 Tax=Litoribacter populi TaxID=2598460 RepID=UPI00117C2C4A|nr:hypothetical protein [Litoribacter populi]